MDHGIRRFTVPKEMEALTPAILERVKKESQEMREIFTRCNLQPLWHGRWIRPVQGRIVSPFGCRTIINNLERSPHSGVDLRAAQGTLIKAPNRGQVVLAADHFFGGLSLVIDHGGAIHSMYFHLSDISVSVGQMVEKGDIIGLTGLSGRATGPHLHFGIRLNGERVNPLRLIELSAGLGPQ
jgi:murein DD-endopeptidase MepM/ murein hydrolase activator NlpD